MLATDWPARTRLRVGWLWSRKWDGVRGFWDGRQMVTRAGWPVDLPARLRRSLPRRWALDGEFTAPGRSPQWLSQVLRLKGTAPQWRSVVFRAFDVHADDMPYAERYRRILTRLRVPHVKQVAIRTGRTVGSLLRMVRQRRWEGVVLRDPEGRYRPGRVAWVRKLKP
jgi:DNA ligase-1